MYAQLHISGNIQMYQIHIFSCLTAYQVSSKEKASIYLVETDYYSLEPKCFPQRPILLRCCSQNHVSGNQET